MSKLEKKPGEFLWVNKNPKSQTLSRSAGPETSLMLKFVQHNRSPNHRRGKSATTKGQYDFIAFDLKAAPRSASKHLPAKSQATPHHQSSPPEIKSLQSKWRLTIPVNNIIPASAIDPFGVTVVPWSHEIHTLLQYARSSILSGGGGYKLEIFQDKLRPMICMYETAVHYLFQDMMYHEHIIYPLLAAFSRRVDTLDLQVETGSSQTREYIRLATRYVRMSLAGSPVETSALSSIATGVHFLVCSATLAGQYQESSLHVHAFQKLLPFVDVKSTIGAWELETASSFDVMNAVATGEMPVIRIAPSDPGPMQPDRMIALQNRLVLLLQDEILSLQTLDTFKAAHPDTAMTSNFNLMANPAADLSLDLGSALEDASESRSLHPSILPVLRKVLACLMVAKIVWHAPDFAEKTDSSWLCRQSRAALHDLTCLSGSEAIDTTMISGMQAEALRLTLMLVLMAAHSRIMHITRTAQVKRLQAALMVLMMSTSAHEAGRCYAEEIDKTAVFDHDEMLIWMLCTGFWAATDLPEAEWFAEMTCTVVIQRVPARSHNDLRAVMRKYLYADTVQGESLKQISHLLCPSILGVV